MIFEAFVLNLGLVVLVVVAGVWFENHTTVAKIISYILFISLVLYLFSSVIFQSIVLNNLTIALLTFSMMYPLMVLEMSQW